jgi:hypothetical protein
MSTYHPLSSAQLEVWLAQQITPDVPNNIAEYIEISGTIDPLLFERSLRLTFNETEAVQVKFIENGEEPLQVFMDAREWNPAFVELSSESDPEIAAQTWMQDDVRRPFNLKAEFPYRAALIKLSEQRYFFYHVVHHIAWDGQSAALFARRVAEIYTALKNKKPVGSSTFGGLELIYQDYDRYRQSKYFQRDQSFWRNYTSALPEPLRLSGHSSSSSPTTLRHSGQILSSAVSYLKASAKSLGVSSSEFLIAAILAYLGRLTNESDLVTRLAVASRSRATRDAVGLMANELPLRQQFERHLSFEQFLERTAKELRAIMRHSRFRGEDIRRELRVLSGQNPYGPSINVMPFNYKLDFGGNKGVAHNLFLGPVDDLCISIYDRQDEGDIRIDLCKGLYQSCGLSYYR